MSASPESSNRPAFEDLNANAQNLLLTALEAYGQSLCLEPDGGVHDLDNLLDSKEFDTPQYRTALLEGFRSGVEEIVLFDLSNRHTSQDAAD